MALFSTYHEISVNETGLNSGTAVIDDTHNVVSTAHRDLVEINDLFGNELAGDVKTAFAGARDSVEKYVLSTNTSFLNLSLTMGEFTKLATTINSEANVLAGGEKDE